MHRQALELYIRTEVHTAGGGHAGHTEPGRLPQDGRSTTAWGAAAVLDHGEARTRVFVQKH
eukprot:COSAG02_NODE_42904_length_380_cov_0.583630_1_plen_60_part_10